MTNFHAKVTQIVGDRFSFFERHITFEVKHLRILVGQLFEQFGLPFIPSSGHTEGQIQITLQPLDMPLDHCYQIWRNLTTLVKFYFLGTF